MPYKDLNKIGLLSDKTVLVDDSFENYRHNIHNTLRIKSFNGM